MIADLEPAIFQKKLSVTFRRHPNTDEVAAVWGGWVRH